jgi:hypothetical protein
MNKRVVVGLLWVASLLLVATIARAQKAPRSNASEPEVIAGPSVGFRVDSYNGSTPVGELVVRRNGSWVAVEFGAKIKPMR